MSNATETMVVSRQWNLPSSFLGEDIDTRILAAFSRAFKELLAKADLKDRAWESRIASFRKHRLTEIAIPRKLTIGRIEIDIPGKNGGEPEKLVRDLKRPVDFGFDKHNLTIDRERIYESDYLEEVASILAYMFIWRMIQAGDPGLLFAESSDKLVLLDRLNQNSLANFLDHYHQAQSTASVFSNFLLARTVDESVDESDIFRGFDELGGRLKVMVQESFDAFTPQFEERIDEAARQALEALERFSKRTKESKCDCDQRGSQAGCNSPECCASSKASCDCKEKGATEKCNSVSCDLIDVLTSHPVQLGHHSIEELVDTNCLRHNLSNKKKS